MLLYSAIGDQLPEGCAEAAALWGICQLAVRHQAALVRRAGIGADAKDAGEQADALFDAILAAPSGVVFSEDDCSESWRRVAAPTGRLQLAPPELFGEIAGLAGERRCYTANTIIRNPEWRRRDRKGALRIHPQDAAGLGLADGDHARVTTACGSTIMAVELSDRMQPGHVSLPNGQGTDFPDVADTGVAPNQLTSIDDRDAFAGTPRQQVRAGQHRTRTGQRSSLSRPF